VIRHLERFLSRSPHLRPARFDFALTNATARQTIAAGEAAHYNLQAEPIAGGNVFPNRVTFSCTGLPALSNCAFAPVQLPSGTTATAVVLTISTTTPNPAGTPPGTYSVTVSATSGSLTRSVHVALTISGSGSSFDFAINNNSGTQTIPAGQTASYNLDVRPLDANTTFPQDVALACSNLPPLSSCSFSPNQVDRGSGDTNVVLSVATTVVVASAQIKNVGWQGVWLILPASVFVTVPLTRPRRRQVAGVLLLLLIALLSACGGGNGNGGGAGHPGTPSGDYTITVTGTCGSIARSVPVPLRIQ